MPKKKPNKHAVALCALRNAKLSDDEKKAIARMGGIARAESLTDEYLSAIASKAARIRWGKHTSESRSEAARLRWVKIKAKKAAALLSVAAPSPSPCWTTDQ